MLLNTTHRRTLRDYCETIHPHFARLFPERSSFPFPSTLVLFQSLCILSFDFSKTPDSFHPAMSVHPSHPLFPLFHELQKLTPLFCHFLTALHLSQGQSQWVIPCLGQGQDYRNVFFDLFRQCCLIFPSLCFKPSEKSHCSCYAMTLFFCFPHWPLKKWLIHHFKYPLMHCPQKKKKKKEAAILFVKRSTWAWPGHMATQRDIKGAHLNLSEISSSDSGL